jgi:hypothetical protein
MHLRATRFFVIYASHQWETAGPVIIGWEVVTKCWPDFLFGPASAPKICRILLPTSTWTKYICCAAIVQKKLKESKRNRIKPNGEVDQWLQGFVRMLPTSPKAPPLSESWIWHHHHHHPQICPNFNLTLRRKIWNFVRTPETTSQPIITGPRML